MRVRLIELTQDDLRTQVEAFVLRHQVIQEGFVGSSGYFYTIRATVKGQAAQGLRLQLLSESTDADDVHEKARALLHQALGFYTGASGRIDLSCEWERSAAQRGRSDQVVPPGGGAG